MAIMDRDDSPYRREPIRQSAKPKEFDLIEFQQLVRDSQSPREIFQIWNDVCGRCDRNEIGRYERDEMWSVVQPALQRLESIKKSMESEK